MLLEHADEPRLLTRQTRLENLLMTNRQLTPRASNARVFPGRSAHEGMSVARNFQDDQLLAFVKQYGESPSLEAERLWKRSGFGMVA
jgi:hypothetical protein